MMCVVVLIHGAHGSEFRIRPEHRNEARASSAEMQEQFQEASHRDSRRDLWLSRRLYFVMYCHTHLMQMVETQCACLRLETVAQV